MENLHDDIEHTLNICDNDKIVIHADGINVDNPKKSEDKYLPNHLSTY